MFGNERLKYFLVCTYWTQETGYSCK